MFYTRRLIDVGYGVQGTGDGVGVGCAQDQRARTTGDDRQHGGDVYLPSTAVALSALVK
ncbi:hypothetical protein [Chloroflexus sp.]|uniref:hypothetical protein n=1 Tax=Chloroflexus sp. TaxID=1904827 RepID=UPI002ADD9FC7|nr:hypothetical protein [Chloroflexus sp.]